MNIDIRNAVKANMKGMDKQQVQSTIENAINSREEKTLPGLGVMFELLWSIPDNQLKETILDKIISKL